MGRERQFDETKVLDAAADVFSAHGYQGTSLAMLQDATGLGKQSLYNTFGDKRALYLQAVDCAAARYQTVQQQMHTAANGRAAVAAFFAHLLELCSSGNAAQQSCIVSAGLLEGLEDSTIQQRLLDKWRSSHELLRAAVERGQKDGSIANPLASAALADLLMALMSGLRVAARAGNPRERLAQTLALGLSLLDSG
jgi:TetR/AcrR family transcriptional regulator, transcriptional repressor for nem operon